MGVKERRKRDKWDHLELLLELLIFGIFVGTIEDVLAIVIVTGASITWHTIGMVVLISVPFAVLGELVFDRIDFASMLRKRFGKGR